MLRLHWEVLMKAYCAVNGHPRYTPDTISCAIDHDCELSLISFVESAGVEIIEYRVSVFPRSRSTVAGYFDPLLQVPATKICDCDPAGLLVQSRWAILAVEISQVQLMRQPIDRSMSERREFDFESHAWAEPRWISSGNISKGLITRARGRASTRDSHFRWKRDRSSGISSRCYSPSDLNATFISRAINTDDAARHDEKKRREINVAK